MIAHPTSYIRARSEPDRRLSPKGQFLKPKLSNYQTLFALLKSGRLICTPHSGGVKLSLAAPTAATQGSRDHVIFKPRMETWTEHSRRMLVFEVPGVGPSSIHINTENGNLIIHGERPPLCPSLPGIPESHSDDQSEIVGGLSEIRYGRFRRVVPIPVGIEVRHITANLKDGLLYVSYPLNDHAEATIQSPQSD